MTIQELTHWENQLCSRVTDLYYQPQTSAIDDELIEIFMQYRDVHQHYADLAHEDIEALKRGLFIQWYALTEPNYLTGICGLEQQAQEKIMQVLTEVIGAGNAEYELVWMTHYYLDWEWVFEQYTNVKGFDLTVLSAQTGSLPATIDRQAMEQRGQMGSYWNSLIRD